MSLDIVTRSWWGAYPSKETVMLTELRKPVENVFYTYTNTYECNSFYHCATVMKHLQSKAIRYKFLEDIYYSFVIGGDGLIYEGRGWYNSPMLPNRFNYMSGDSLYIAYMGRAEGTRPKDIMRKARYELIQYGIAMNYIQPNFRKMDIILRPYNSRQTYEA